MKLLLLLPFIVLLMMGFRAGYKLQKKMILHWEEVVSNSVDLPKYELLEHLDREVYRHSEGFRSPWLYKEACESRGIEPLYFWPVIQAVVVQTFLFLVCFAVWAASG